MLDAKCNRCGGDLGDFGAVVVSPPKNPRDPVHKTDKYHICLDCWPYVLAFIYPEKTKASLKKKSGK